MTDFIVLGIFLAGFCAGVAFTLWAVNSALSNFRSKQAAQPQE
jgi:hypothetical protein